MPFIRRHEIDPALRHKFEGAHKARLRQALLDPGLSASQRVAIKQELDQVGKPKIYSADSAPRAGSVSFDKEVA